MRTIDHFAAAIAAGSFAHPGRIPKADIVAKQAGELAAALCAARGHDFGEHEIERRCRRCGDIRDELKRCPRCEGLGVFFEEPPTLDPPRPVPNAPVETAPTEPPPAGAPTMALALKKARELAVAGLEETEAGSAALAWFQDIISACEEGLDE